MGFLGLRSALQSPSGAFASTGVDAFANYYVSPRDGFSIRTGSGHDYSLSTPVPEPKTWMTLSLGLVALAAARRRLHAATRS